MNNNKYWQRAGIEEADGFRALLFNPSSNTLVAHMYRLLNGNIMFSDLYIRGKDDKKYSALLAKEEDVSFESPVSSPFGPYLYTVVLKAVREHGDYSGGYDSVEVRKVDLKSRRVVARLPDTGLKCEPPYYRVWVSGILGVGPTEDTLYCTVGMQRKVNDEYQPVDYKLCLVSMVDGNIQVVSQLHETFI